MWTWDEPGGLEAPNSDGTSQTKADRDAIACALETGHYSDMQIVCGGRAFQAHKLIVCSRSPFFHNAFSKMDMEEQRTGRITLVDKQPEVIKAMLDFLYTRNYVEAYDEPADVDDVADGTAHDSEPENACGEEEQSISDEPMDAADSAESTAPDSTSETALGQDQESVNENISELASETNSDPHGEQLDRGFMTFNIEVYALATEYFIPDLKRHAFLRLNKSMETGYIPEPEDVYKAVLVMHRSIPENEKAVYDFMASFVAIHMVDLYKHPAFDYLVAYCGRFLARVAMQAITFSPEEVAGQRWNCAGCGSSRHSKKCQDCNKLDYCCGRPGIGTRGRGGATRAVPSGPQQVDGWD